jgi:hypothetical protein
MRALKTMICAIVVGSAGLSVTLRSQSAAHQQRSTPSPPVTADAENVRAEIRSLEIVLPRIPDRGATLFLLARRYAHLSDLQKALALLKLLCRDLGHQASFVASALLFFELRKKRC